MAKRPVGGREDAPRGKARDADLAPEGVGVPEAGAGEETRREPKELSREELEELRQQLQRKYR